MAESPTTFKVWIALLAACRESGIAYVSSVYLSSICHLPQGKVEDALRHLESPDEHSRSLADDGRRIRRVDGGYEIINYVVYRDFSLKDAEAERKRLYRQRLKGCPDIVPKCPDPSASVSASASASVPGFDAFWNLYPRKVAKKVAAKAYAASVKAGADPADLLKAIEGYVGELKRNGTEPRYVLHPSTFIHEERWKDYLNIERPRQMGESDGKDKKSPEYWATVRGLKEQGLTGQALTDALAKAGLK
jgi:hypothetical protein